MVSFTHTSNDLINSTREFTSQNVIWVKNAVLLPSGVKTDSFYNIHANVPLQVTGFLDEIPVKLSGMYIGNLTLLMGERTFYLLPYEMIDQEVIPVIDSPLIYNGKSYEPLFKIGNTLSHYKGLFFDENHPIKLKGTVDKTSKSTLNQYGISPTHFQPFGKRFEVEFNKVNWLALNKVFEGHLIAKYEYNHNTYWVIFEE